MKIMNRKGFTLIELLVVIAIIGILASVVLASLNSARTSGSDAAVASNLANARAEAELFYDSNTRSYEGVCNTSGTNTIGDNVTAAANASGASYAYDSGTNDSGVPSATSAACHDSKDNWVAQAPVSADKYHCVDWTGASKEVATPLTAGQLSCPSN